MEALAYAFGAADLCAASVGAPHIRQRLWFVGMGDTYNQGSQGRTGMPECSDQLAAGSGSLESGVGVADGIRAGRDRRAVSCKIGSEDGQHVPEHADAPGGAGRLADAGDGSGQRSEPRAVERGLSAQTRRDSPITASGEVDSFWGDADWLFCRDGKWRPVEPGTFPLADGVSARVGRLRGYGNAIVPQVAEVFIRAALNL
jgi:DNA (cytosine-5)-methyltransferase 1